MDSMRRRYYTGSVKTEFMYFKMNAMAHLSEERCCGVLLKIFLQSHSDVRFRGQLKIEVKIDSH